MSTPYIHLFQTSESKYMYDVNMDQILKVPDFFYETLKDDVSLKNASEKAKNYADRLHSFGYLKTNRVERVEHPARRTMRNEKSEALSL